MKTIKKLLLGTSLMMLMMFIMPFVVQAAGTIQNDTTGDSYATLSEAIGAASEGDTLLVSDGTYTENITINKALTLKGTGKDKVIIKGQVDIASNNAEVTIEDLAISMKGADTSGIKVAGQSKVTVKNTLIEYDGYTETDYGTNDYFTGIWLTKTADGSTLTLNNVEMYAKYGVWVYGQENTVSIINSNLTGWAPLDISNGTSATSLATNNKVSIEGSTLIGEAVAGDTNEYATIVIGGQDGLQLEITGSTITNKFLETNTQDLIAYGEAYKTSKNVIVAISDSTLKNNDTTGNSAVYNLGTSENADSANVNMLLLDSNNTITAANGNTINLVGDYVTLTFIAEGEKAVFTLAKGSVFTSAPEDPEVDGYTFKGWYTDDTYTTEYDFTQVINDNTEIYAKFQKNPVDQSSEDNPATSDNIALYIAIALISVVGIGVNLKKIKRS